MRKNLSGRSSFTKLRLVGFEEPISIPYVGNIVRANIWPNYSLIKVTRGGENLLIHLSEDDLDEIDTIIELEI